MKNIIIGNGVNIQFSGKDYLNNTILKRSVNRTLKKKVPEKILTNESVRYFKELFKFVPSIVQGNHDKLAVTSYEKEILPHFKSRNKYAVSNKKYEHVGIEDYLFVHTLFCKFHHIENPECYTIRKVLERFILDGIYNEGKINEIYCSFPAPFKIWLNQYDEIFTTNYDFNLDKTLENKSIYHLHGAFHIMHEVYDKKSLRNKLGLDDYDYYEGYDYLYCNAILDFSGSSKEFIGKQSQFANSGIEKFVNVYHNNDIEKINEIEKMKNYEDELTRTLYRAIQYSLNNPEEKFREEYCFDKLEHITGELTILGLSPSNDSHLLRIIKTNNNLNKIIFYYYDIKEAQQMKQYLSPKNIIIKDVKEFWKQF